MFVPTGGVRDDQQLRGCDPEAGHASSTDPRGGGIHPPARGLRPAAAGSILGTSTQEAHRRIPRSVPSHYTVSWGAPLSKLAILTGGFGGGALVLTRGLWGDV